MKILAYVIGFIVIVTTVVQLSVAMMGAVIGGTIISVIRQVDEADEAYKANRRAEFAEARAVVGATENGQIKPGFLLLKNFESLRRGRQVSVTRYVQPSDLLSGSEILPKKQLLGSFVEARAVRFGEEECAILLGALASECEVLSVSSREIRNTNHRLYSVHVRMNFVQKGDFGSVEPDKRHAYSEKSQKFPGRSGMRANDIDLGRRVTARLYGEVFSHCERLKRDLGNCAIGAIRMDNRLDRDARRTEMSLRTTFSHVSPI